MRICLTGMVKNTKNGLLDIEEIIKQVENIIIPYCDSDEIDDALTSIDRAVMTIDALRDTIIALLKGDVNKEQVIEFFDMKQKLDDHVYSNELIIFKNKEGKIEDE